MDHFSEIREILDRWEVGRMTHWVAMSEIRRIVGGENKIRKDREMIQEIS